jgi:hypothetical protein
MAGMSRETLGMRRIVTDKVARRECNFRPMIEIELPCCGAIAHLEQLADEVDCDECGVTLELGEDHRSALPLAA